VGDWTSGRAGPRRERAPPSVFRCVGRWWNRGRRVLVHLRHV